VRSDEPTSVVEVPANTPGAVSRPRRRVVVVPVPAPVGTVVGIPGFSGLSAFKQRRCEVYEELLLAGLSIDAEAVCGA
jgi:hypothetical protein